MPNDNKKPAASDLSAAPCYALADGCKAGSLNHWRRVLRRWEKAKEIEESLSGDLEGKDVISGSLDQAQQDVVDLTRWMVSNAYIFK